MTSGIAAIDSRVKCKPGDCKEQRKTNTEMTFLTHSFLLACEQLRDNRAHTHKHRNTHNPVCNISRNSFIDSFGKLSEKCALKMRKAKKNINIHSYFFILLLQHTSAVMCKFCATSDPLAPRHRLTNLVKHRNKKMISFEIPSHSLTLLKKTKLFKSQDGIKGKNSISQQALRLSEHSRVCG